MVSPSVFFSRWMRHPVIESQISLGNNVDASCGSEEGVRGEEISIHCDGEERTYSGNIFDRK